MHISIPALSLIAAVLHFSACVIHAEQTFEFATPSDDRWHYPFNFTPGNRPTASCFGSTSEGFNNRDGIVIIAWNTTDMIIPGQGAENYDIQRVRVTLTNQSGANWAIDTTPDEWFTCDLNDDGVLNGDGIPRDESGDVDGESDDVDLGRPIELFGAGFGPLTAYETWIETSFYKGSNGGSNLPRDPFPFVFQEETFALIHCEDNLRGLFNENLVPPVGPFTPQPWATGTPVNYTPGNQPVPFAVEFTIDLDLSDGAVREYFQSQLDGGRVFVIVTSLQEAEQQGSPVNFPSFFMKEETLTAGAKPGKLEIVLGACDQSAGDIDGDGDVDGADVSALAAVLTGEQSDPGHLERSDLNDSGAADGADIGPFLAALLQPCE